MQSMKKDHASLLLALRTRTVRGIRRDFGDMYPDKQCSQPDSLPHTLSCRELQEAMEAPSLVHYKEVFSQDTEVQQETVERIALLLEARDKILSSTTNQI